MIRVIWLILQDQSNRDELAWIGSGVVVVIGALWTMWKFFHPRNRESLPSSRVTAAGGGVSAGRDINNSNIDTRGQK